MVFEIQVLNVLTQLFANDAVTELWKAYAVEENWKVLTDIFFQNFYFIEACDLLQIIYQFH